MFFPGSGFLLAKCNRDACGQRTGAGGRRSVALALALDSVKERQLVGVARGYVSKRRVKCVLHGKATRRKNSAAFENVQFVNA